MEFAVLKGKPEPLWKKLGIGKRGAPAAEASMVPDESGNTKFGLKKRLGTWYRGFQEEVRTNVEAGLAGKKIQVTLREAIDAPPKSIIDTLADPAFAGKRNLLSTMIRWVREDPELVERLRNADLEPSWVSDVFLWSGLEEISAPEEFFRGLRSPHLSVVGGDRRLRERLLAEYAAYGEAWGWAVTIIACPGEDFPRDVEWRAVHVVEQGSYELTEVLSTMRMEVEEEEGNHMWVFEDPMATIGSASPKGREAFQRAMSLLDGGRVAVAAGWDMMGHADFLGKPFRHVCGKDKPKIFLPAHYAVDSSEHLPGAYLVALEELSQSGTPGAFMAVERERLYRGAIA